MKNIIIDDKIINLDRIHFTRLISKTELLISFGTDFVRIKGTKEKIESVIKTLKNGGDEKLFCNSE
jgi:hypothetical protein